MVYSAARNRESKSALRTGEEREKKHLSNLLLRFRVRLHKLIEQNRSNLLGVFVIRSADDILRSQDLILIHFNHFSRRSST